jgi:cytochrome c oxidase subunit 3
MNAAAWNGGARPFAIGSKKLGMWLFVVSDSLTFAALLVAYTYLRMASPSWPKPFQFSPGIIFVSMMTFVLLSSSLTMVTAVQAMQKGDRRTAARWIFATVACGVGFIVLHAMEWSHLLKESWSEPLFGATFFTITGLHMTHVAVGAIYLSVIGAGVFRGKFTEEDVEVSGLYWHFVDLVWMFIFPLIYLMSVKGAQA